MTKQTKITKEQLLKLIDDLKRKPEDKVRILGDIGITVFGAFLGAAGSGTLAAAAGATSIFGVGTVASWVGLTVVAATPVGWVLGGAAAAGTAAYAVSRLIRNGGMSEGKKAELLTRYREEVRAMTAKEEAGSITDADKTRFIFELRDLVAKDVIPPEVAFRFIDQVERGTLPISQAFALIRDLLSELNLEPNPSPGTQPNVTESEALKANGLLGSVLQAAKEGDVIAQNRLGNLYFEGDGVDADEMKAIHWFHLAAEQGHVESQGSLGLLYYCSENSHTRHKSIRWLRLAGEQGHDKAQVLLGTVYHNGEIVGKDLMEALKWYRLAAEQGNPDAQTGIEDIGVDRV